MPEPPHQFFTITADRALAERWRAAVAPLGGTHVACDGLMTALRRMPEQPVDIVLVDPSGADLSIESVLQKIRHRAPGADLVLAMDGSREQSEGTARIDPAILDRWGASQPAAS